MDDYLTRVAEAVRDATPNKAWQIGNNGPLRSAVDLQAVIASVPRPEPGIIYQIRLPGDSESIWRDATESAFWVTTEKNRRIVYAEPVAAQPAVPVGYDPKEIDNVFSTLRYVIGLNPGKKAPTAHCQDIIERVASWSDMGKFHPMYSQYRAAAADRAMLAAAPEAPQTIQCNACDWIGSSADARYLGGREPIGPLCPECHETTGPADDAARPE